MKNTLKQFQRGVEETVGSALVALSRNTLTQWLTNFLIVVFSLLIILSFAGLWRTHVQPNNAVGTPVYNGPCPLVIQTANRAFENQRFLNEHIEKDQSVNRAYYRTQVRGILNDAFNYASFCEDKAAVGRLIYMAANINMDAAIINVNDPKVSLVLSIDFYRQAKELGWTTINPVENSLWRYRIRRVAILTNQPIPKL